ncbi:hypothetical protein EMIHUDRAFT_215552 [Emiliania huxleyi CCMP1516]|uniref:Uncharacterized protein n=2 Tax=Emiliania huxleyi TaxID=2903 RepID=A0A0D3IHK2_EMIH1|nr:hypothetical protein EMIHUDRAFT_215552 [Emiliania huxleyi CCMP1516]EOD10737.1 hypothetical protein EMIHUDRAFT_215552 [Emiliania huxleyi CCMP1516]|eukprot:XP_005763166.1 hypothetical protein EMIHUDRAFT_215552 [Emiliania huxleyi CCMP1516]
MGGRPLWQAEIGRIIARTEENLRAPRTGPPLYKVPRVAEAAFTAPLLHAPFMPSAASVEERRTTAPAATVPIEPSPPPSASGYDSFEVHNYGISQGSEDSACCNISYANNDICGYEVGGESDEISNHVSP